MRYFIVTLCALLCEITSALGQTTSIAPAPAPPLHPKICVVLSGGGARGFAHLGVLRYLEEHHIPINCIAGTSMGAVIGGLYAAGLSADEIEHQMNEVNLEDVALDVVDRRKISQTLREDDENYPIAGTFGISNGSVTLPRGAIQANQFLQLLHSWTSHIPNDIKFDDLPIPFRAVATDLETGKMVVFDHGPLHLAIRASMAAPGVFAPVEYNGQLLADGGLVQNLPVDIARSMGADIIIAVNIGTPLLHRDDLRGLLNVSKQMVNILTEQNVNEQKKNLHQTDVLIEPNLGNISFMDFQKEKDASDIGYNAAQADAEQLAKLVLEPAAYYAQLKDRPDHDLKSVKIGFVDIHTTGKIPPDDIRRQLNIQLGSNYDPDVINNAISPLLNSRQFDSITYNLTQRDGVYGLEVEASERNWGPNFVRVGLEMMTGFDGQSNFELQIGHRLPWITDSGLEWRNDLEIGSIYGLRSELRQPVFSREGTYLAPFVSIEKKDLNLYSDNQTYATYRMETAQTGLEFGIPIGAFATVGELRTGFIATHYDLNPRIGSLIIENDSDIRVSSLPWIKMNEYAYHAKLTIDQLDAPVFPREGFMLNGELLAGVNQDESSSDVYYTNPDLRGFHQLTGGGTWAYSVDDHSVNMSLEAGARNQAGTPVPGVGLVLGGFQKLTAYQPDEFIGNYLLYGNVTYLYRAVDLGLAGKSAFIGSSFEIGNAADQKSDFALTKLKKSLSLFVGASTFMGPTHFGVAIAPGGEFNLFLQLGRP